MTATVFGLVGVLLGVILGFLLTEFGAQRQQEQSEERQRHSVRTILSLEVEENLRLLWFYWGTVKKLPDGADGDAITRSRRLSQVPMPGWSHRAWESLVGSLAVALSAQEIRYVHIHHSRLDQITAIRAQLSDFAEKQEAKLSSLEGIRGRVESMADSSRPFDRNAAELWASCERTVGELYKRGNPLPEEAMQIHGGEARKDATMGAWVIRTVAALVFVTIGAGVAVGVMAWEPWTDELDAAKCEAALKSFQEARSLADDNPNDLTEDLRTSAGAQWMRECHLEWED
jgi:hypothetical protein